MKSSIKTVYVIHHSHTDIGYTDLQERVIAIQVNYIKTVLDMMRKPEYDDFRWNCETLYCVEEFWHYASEEDRADFAKFVKEGKIGISANYLNFNDLVDTKIYSERLAEWEHRLPICTAMAADVNGFSMGYRDAMLENGVEFLFTNVHCHHGMYPLYQNQNAFFWENDAGKRLLVWNGEHYNLGNVLGIQPNHAVNWMMRNRLGDNIEVSSAFVEQLHDNLNSYLSECESEGYPYDFIVTAVSGVFSDNAPPSAEIIETIRAYNNKYGEKVRIEMVSLQELYASIAPKLTNVPVYRGDWTDWWANGVGSTPYAVKHYKDADHRYQLAKRLDANADINYPELIKTAQDNLLLYAEHTWGHSSTITNPYDTMVLNLDMRKNSYASKAHEAASLMLCLIAEQKGDLMRYYNTTGIVRASGVSHTKQPQLVEFYVETISLDAIKVLDATGREYTCQVSPHPRGKKISFIDTLVYGEEKEYTYTAVQKPNDNQFASYEERRALGRNIRGKHAETYIGQLMEVSCMEHGPVFTQLRLKYKLEGTVKADVLIKLYEDIPRIDFTLELGKTISEDVESVFMSFNLNRAGSDTVLRKGGSEAFRPGVDQLPGSCMEFYMSDDGVASVDAQNSVLIAARDVPLVYMGSMNHHPIKLCDKNAENNARPLYSWIMNNNWETNFKMDLSGFCQYDYSLWLSDITMPDAAMDELHEQLFDPYVLIIG